MSLFILFLILILGIPFGIWGVKLCCENNKWGVFLLFLATGSLGIIIGLMICHFAEKNKENNDELLEIKSKLNNLIIAIDKHDDLLIKK